VAHALPKAFVDDLRELVDRFEQAIHDREAGKDDHAAARANITAALSSRTAAVSKLNEPFARGQRVRELRLASRRRLSVASYSRLLDRRR
jgi:ElaB/YqjD/DUF883 family membrane-anchored ribosome-binding protein